MAEFTQILVGAVAVAELILERLADPQRRGDGHRARFRVRAEDVADQKIAALVFVEVFAHGQPGEEIVPRAILFLFAQAVENGVEHAVSRFRAQAQEQVLLGPGDRQRLADGSAPLADNGAHLHAAAKPQRHARPPEMARPSRQRTMFSWSPLARPPRVGTPGKSGVPLREPAFRVEAQRVGQDDPCVHALGIHAAFHLPVGRAGRFLHLRLGKLEHPQFRLRQAQQQQREPGPVLRLAPRADESAAGTAHEQRRLAVNAHQFEEILQVFGVIGRKKEHRETHLRIQLGARLPRGVLDGFLRVIGKHKARGGSVRHHGYHCGTRMLPQRPIVRVPHRRT